MPILTERTETGWKAWDSEKPDINAQSVDRAEAISIVQGCIDGARHKQPDKITAANLDVGSVFRRLRAILEQHIARYRQAHSPCEVAWLKAVHERQMHLLTALESVADISEALSRCAEPVNTLNDILTTLTLPIDRYFHRQYLEAAQNANRAVTLLEQALPLLLPDDMATVRALIAKYRDVAQTIESQLGEPVIGVHNVATKGNAKHSPEGAKRSSAVQTLGAVIPDSTPRKYRLICDILQAAGDHDVTREKVKRLLNR